MRLMPKRVKFRKSQRGRIKGKATRGNTLAIGEYGLQSLESGWVSAEELEAGRIASSHFLGKSGRLYIRVFPHKSVTAKPVETRMGKGKGEPEFWAAVVKPGTILYELAGVPEESARQACNRVAHNPSVKVRMVTRRA
ncbi:MAG TPA: 50S ribosomal protein L16 [Candidatus Hypogeohydataceae bacterium YC40]